MNPNLIVSLVTIALVLIIVAVRVRRMMREVRWNPVAMWIVPVIFALLTGAIAVIDRVTGAVGIAAITVALIAGGGLGWLQGMHTAVRVDKANRAMYVKLSPVGIAIFIAVIVLRIGVRGFAGGFASPAASPGTMQAGSDLVAIVSVALLALITGMSIGVRAYLQREYSQAA